MPVNYEQLRLDTIGVMDPRIEKLFQKHLMHVVRDCEDRGVEDNAERSITLTFGVTPMVNPDTHEVDEVAIKMKCKSGVPDYQTKAFPMAVDKGKLLFNADAPNSLRQTTLPANDE